MSSSDEDELYEIEHVLRAKVDKRRGRKIQWKYYIKWRGYDDDANSWEPEEMFENASLALRDFWNAADLGGRDHNDGTLFKIGEEIEIAVRSSPRRKTIESLESVEQATPSRSTRTRHVVDSGDEISSPQKVKEQKQENETPSRMRRMPQRYSDESPAVSTRSRTTKTGANSISHAGSSRHRSKKAQVDSEDETSGNIKPSRSVSQRRRKEEASSRAGPSSHKAEPVESQSTRSSKRKQNDTRGKAKAVDSDDDKPLRPVKKRKPSSKVSTSKSRRSTKKKAYDSGDSSSSPPRQLPVKTSKKTFDGVELTARRRIADSATPVESNHAEKDNDGITLPPSPAGSLFSGDEENVAREEEMAVENDTSAVTPDPPTKDSEVIVRRSFSMEAPVDQPIIPFHRAREANPLVKRIEDPQLDAAFQARVKSKQGEAETSRHTPNVASSSRPKQQSGRSFVPNRSLLTFTKSGNLKVERQPISNQPSQSRRSTSHERMLPSGAGSSLSADKQATGDAGVPAAEVSQSAASIDTTDLFEDTDTDAPGEPDDTIMTPPPTAGELLGLAGATNGGDDLPMFVEDTNAMGAGANDVQGGSAGSTSVPMSLDQPPSALPAGSADVNISWRQSTIFGPATPIISSSSSAFPFINSSPPTGKPNQQVVSIRLNPSFSVPVVMKDVQPSMTEPIVELTEALIGQFDGPPGKVYMPDVLQFVQTGGSSARISLDSNASEEQKVHFGVLQDELDKGKLFVFVLGNCTLALLSSQNIAIGEKMKIPKPLVGLSKTIVMTNIIVNATQYMNFTSEAVDLKLC